MKSEQNDLCNWIVGLQRGVLTATVKPRLVQPVAHARVLQLVMAGSDCARLQGVWLKLCTCAVSHSLGPFFFKHRFCLCFCQWSRPLATAMVMTIASFFIFICGGKIRVCVLVRAYSTVSRPSPRQNLDVRISWLLLLLPRQRGWLTDSVNEWKVICVYGEYKFPRKGFMVTAPGVHKMQNALSG